jgi:hypothetical protein
MNHSNHSENQAVNKILLTVKLMKSQGFVSLSISSHLREIALVNILCLFHSIIIRNGNEIFYMVLQGLGTK